MMNFRLVAALVTLSSLEARAIVLHHDGESDGAAAQPENHAVTLNQALHIRRAGVPDFPYWEHVGMVGLGSGIYLGNGWVMTSAHVGCYPFKLSDGNPYQPVYRTWRVLQNPGGGKSDLAVFKVEIGGETSQLARLGRLRIGPLDPAGDAPLVMIGTGYVEKPSPTDVADSKFTLGYQVQPHREKRWAFTSLDKMLDQPAPTTGGYRTTCFASRFHRIPFEGQAVEGDSGGAVFAYNPKLAQWTLVGCIFAVSHQYVSYVPFGARTYLGNLESYRAQLPAADAGEFALAD